MSVNTSIHSPEFWITPLMQYKKKRKEKEGCHLAKVDQAACDAPWPKMISLGVCVCMRVCGRTRAKGAR